MIYADYEFYTEEYLHGATPLMDEPTFLRHAEAASDRINRRNWTDERLTELFDNTSDGTMRKLKMCVCELADMNFNAEEKEAMSMIPSESNGTYSRGAVRGDTGAVDVGKLQTGVINRRLALSELHMWAVYVG